MRIGQGNRDLFSRKRIMWGVADNFGTSEHRRVKFPGGKQKNRILFFKK